MNTVRPSPWLLRELLPVLACTLLVLIVGIILWQSGGLPNYWNSDTATDLLSWSGGILLLALMLRIFSPDKAHLLFGGSLLLYLASGLEFVTSAGTALFFVSAWCAGKILLRLLCPFEDSFGVGLTRPLLIGMALLLSLFSLMIQLPINYPAVHLSIMFAPILWLVFSTSPIHWQHAGAVVAESSLVPGSIRYWLFCCMLLILAGVARYVFYPSISYDDNALHLRMWTMLSWQHEYTFDVVAHVGEVSPFAVDLLHGVCSLIVGADARGAINLFLFALLGRQIWQILQLLGCSATHSLLLLTLFASTPLTGNLLVTLQTELFMALLTTSGVRLLLEAGRSWYTGTNAALLAVAALCVATKLPGLVLCALLLLVALLRFWPLRWHEISRQPRKSQLVLLLYLVALLILAGISYLQAWLLTGNPVFPHYNDIFQSPFFYPESSTDMRWQTGFSLSSYWNAFLHTSEHYESQDYVAGFQYLILLPLGLLALPASQPRSHVLTLLIPLAGFGLVMFATTQYWRYLFPVMPLATCAIAALLSGSRRTPVVAAIVGCIALNVWFYPGISWILSVSPGDSRHADARAMQVENYSPAQALSAHVNDIAPGSRVLYHPDHPNGARLHGDPYYTAWYAPSRYQRSSEVDTASSLQEFLASEAIDFIIWDMSDNTTYSGTRWLVRDYLAHQARPVKQAGNLVLFKPHDKPLHYEEVLRLEELTATREPVVVSRYDLGGNASGRYSARFSCDSTEGYFIAQINWDTGAPFYRLVRCGAAVDFIESIVIPESAREAHVYVTARDTDKVTVEWLTLETY